MWECPKSMSAVIALLAAGVVVGMLVGGSLAVGTCSVIYMINR